jgi:hypothetical protein
MVDGLSGSESTQASVPKYIEDASKDAIGLAQGRNKLGFAPFYGPEVAAFNPMQMQAMEGSNLMAQSLGLPTQQQQMPAPTDFGGGILGHSSQPLYQNNMDMFQKANPDLFAALRALTGGGMDPQGAQQGQPMANAGPARFGEPGYFMEGRDK